MNLLRLQQLVPSLFISMVFFPDAKVRARRLQIQQLTANWDGTYSEALFLKKTVCFQGLLIFKWKKNRWMNRAEKHLEYMYD